jgi:hypothetical protein
MIEIITAAGFALAWAAFRYDRHVRWRAAVDAAHGTLSAVYRGMVEGVVGGGETAWGQHYLHNIYTDKAARERAKNTNTLVMTRQIDQVLVVPTEPLAMLATTTPHPGLIEERTVAIASTALWRVGVFNQLVQQLTDFNAAHAVEISSDRTELERREDIAGAAMVLSYLVHRDGIGEAWAEHPNGAVGWYRALVGALMVNMKSLEELQNSARWRWLREWPYLLLDLFALVGLVVVIATVLAQDVGDDGRGESPPAATTTG